MCSKHSLLLIDAGQFLSSHSSKIADCVKKDRFSLADYNALFWWLVPGIAEHNANPISCRSLSAPQLVAVSGGTSALPSSLSLSLALSERSQPDRYK